MPTDKEEYIKYYDENHNFLGIEKRSVVDKKHFWYDIVALWVIDKNNKKVLLQKRSKFKRFDPGVWSTVAGHVKSDESYIQAIFNEAKEEIGIDLKNFELRPLMPFTRNDCKNSFFSYYYIVANIPLTQFKLQKEELDDVKYFDYETLKAEVKKGNKNFSFVYDEFYQKTFAALDEIVYGKHNLKQIEGAKISARKTRGEII